MSIVADIFFMDMEKELIHEEGVEYLFEGELELPDMTNVNMISVMDLLTGAVERIEMRMPKVLQSNPKKAMFTFRDLLGCEDIYER